MIETPATYAEAMGRSPRTGAPMRRFSYHTGAPVRPLAPDEPCPILFRDLGPMATALYLRGTLTRLAGPYCPIVYTRTEGYVEPYTDHGRIGRLIFLRPVALAPAFSGIAPIYVAPVVPLADLPPETVAYVPAHVPLACAAAEARDMRTARELREAFGGAEYDDALADALERIDALERTLEASEHYTDPLRRLLQSGDRGAKTRARALLEDAGLDERDLCTAWHHLPADRREAVAGLAGFGARISSLTDSVRNQGGILRSNAEDDR